MRPRLGSMFSGVGGLDLAIHDALNAETVFVADVCKFTENKKTGSVTIGHHEPHRSPCSVLAHRFPDVPNLGDVSLIKWTPNCPDCGHDLRTAAGDQVILEDGEGNWLNMSRTDARLFAKRINECLDATVKR